jgi:hypothetical protein
MNINDQITFRLGKCKTLFTGRIVQTDATEINGHKIDPSEMPCLIVKCNHGFNWIVPVGKVVA